MRITLDLSKHADAVSAQYQRLSKTQIRLLASQVPETFLARLQDVVRQVGRLCTVAPASVPVLSQDITR